MRKQNHCIGCKYLYISGTGYSDWTWMESYVKCALNRNPLLERDIEQNSTDSRVEGEASNEAGIEVEDMLHELTLPNIIRASKWLPIAHRRCDQYDFGPLVIVSPDGNVRVQGSAWDEQQKLAIYQHRGMDEDNDYPHEVTFMD